MFPEARKSGLSSQCSALPYANPAPGPAHSTAGREEEFPALPGPSPRSPANEGCRLREGAQQLPPSCQVPSFRLRGFRDSRLTRIYRHT